GSAQSGTGPDGTSDAVCRMHPGAYSTRRSTLPGFCVVYVDIVTVPHDQPIRLRRGILRRARTKSTTVPISFTAVSPRTIGGLFVGSSDISFLRMDLP